MAALCHLAGVSLLAVVIWAILSGCIAKGLSADVKISVTPFYSKGKLNKYYIPVGSTVNVTCKLTSSDCDVTNLTLKLGNNDTTIVNTSSISLSRTLTSPGSPLFSCCVNQTECPSIFDAEYNHKQDVASLYIGYHPTKVNNFYCHSIALTNLICSWTVDPGNSTEVIWKMTYGIFNGADKVNDNYCINTNCQCRLRLNGTRYTCIVTPGHFQERSNYSIVVSGENDYGTSTYKTFVYTGLTISTYEKLKNLTITTRGSTWLNITWQAADTSLLNQNTTYRVIVHDDSHSVLRVMTNDTRYNVTRLKPYTVYTVTIQARPYGDNYENPSVWSEPLTGAFCTEEDKPSSPPVITPVGFNWWSRDSDPRLTVYWKAVPIESRNGIVVHYLLRLRSFYDVNYTRDAVVPSNVYSYTWKTIYPRSKYNVTIQAGTHVGYSQPSMLLIPPMDVTERYGVEYVIAERLTSSLFNISWVTSQRDIQNISVTWSLGSSPDEAMLFDWGTFPSTSSFALVSPTITTPNLRDDVVLWFGVALTLSNWTSGITWNLCVFGHQSETNQVPLVDLTTTEHELIVVMRFSLCDSVLMKSRPSAYNVMYGKHMMRGDCTRTECLHGQHKIVPADFNTTSISIVNLQQDVDYCVCMRILYRNGTGPSTDPASVRLKAPSTFLANTTMQVIGGVLGAVAITVLLIGFVLCKRKLCKKYVIDTSLLKGLENENRCSDSKDNQTNTVERAVPNTDRTNEEETLVKEVVSEGSDVTNVNSLTDTSLGVEPNQRQCINNVNRPFPLIDTASEEKTVESLHNNMLSNRVYPRKDETESSTLKNRSTLNVTDVAGSSVTVCGVPVGAHGARGITSADDRIENPPPSSVSPLPERVTAGHDDDAMPSPHKNTTVHYPMKTNFNYILSTEVASAKPVPDVVSHETPNSSSNDNSNNTPAYSKFTLSESGSSMASCVVPVGSQGTREITSADDRIENPPPSPQASLPQSGTAGHNYITVPSPHTNTAVHYPMKTNFNYVLSTDVASNASGVVSNETPDSSSNGYSNNTSAYSQCTLVDSGLTPDVSPSRNYEALGNTPVSMTRCCGSQEVDPNNNDAVSDRSDNMTTSFILLSERVATNAHIQAPSFTADQSGYMRLTTEL